jgi:hypothetical protein
MKKITILVLLLCLNRTYLNAQYCMLPGETAYSNLQPGITNFKLNSINRTSGNVESPTSVVVTTGLTTTLVQGQTYSISITHSEDNQFFPGARNNLRVWIDYNSNFTLNDAGETILSKDLEAPNTTYTANFTVPLSAPTGTTMLRATAKMSADAGHTIPTPCDNPPDPLGYHGEMEDYIVNILPANPTPTAYCTLPGRTPYSPNTPGITNFKLGNINRSSAASENATGVVVSTGSVITLAKGITYSLSLTHSKDAVTYPSARNNIRVWIDYNTNFIFTDAGETIISADLQNAGTYTANITIPSTVTVGQKILRATAKMSADGGNTMPTPCDEPQDPAGYRGEVEDYIVDIVATLPNPVGLNEPESRPEDISLFPNPFSNELTISFDANETKTVSAELFDVSGKRVLVLLENKSVSPGMYTYNFNLNEYLRTDGIYYLEFKTNDSITYKKLIKMGKQD